MHPAVVSSSSPSCSPLLPLAFLPRVCPYEHVYLGYNLHATSCQLAIHALHHDDWANGGRESASDYQRLSLEQRQRRRRRRQIGIWVCLCVRA